MYPGIPISEHAIYILDNNGDLNTTYSRYPLPRLDEDQEHIVKVILQRKGFYRSTNGKDEGKGQYLLGAHILYILKENPEWIRIKIASNKFGL